MIEVESPETPVVEIPVKMHRQTFPGTKRKTHECLYIDYEVRNPEGIMVNEVVYGPGVVNVPTCLANFLTEQDQHWANTEIKLLRNGGNNMSGGKIVASFRG